MSEREREGREGERETDRVRRERARTGGDRQTEEGERGGGGERQ